MTVLNRGRRRPATYGEPLALRTADGVRVAGAPLVRLAGAS